MAGVATVDLRGRPSLFPPSLRVERGADDNDGTDESADLWDPLVDLDGARGLVLWLLIVTGVLAFPASPSSLLLSSP